MSVSRRRFLGTTGAVLAAPYISNPALAQAQVQLKLHHFLPPVANVPAKLLTPWARQVEQDSGGKIKIDLFPSMQLGGTPPQLYDQARDGVVDIVWTLPGSTAGRFPSTEVFELPFVAARRGTTNARAAQEYAETNVVKETSDVKLLSYWCHDHGLIHATKAVKTMDDLKGLKLRSPTRLAGEALKALGATGVPMPIPQVPESLAQGVINGAVVPWEVVPAIKLNELVKFHSEIPGTPTLYTAGFFLAMNKAKYEGLPADLKAAIDKNSGMAFAEKAGQVWDEQGKTVSEMVKSKGGEINSISEDEKARWIKATEPVIEGWVKQVKDKGLDGNKLLEQARALIAKYDKT